MKARITRISLIAAAVFWPSWVFAAEGEQVQGNWFALIFYAVNFLFFVWIVWRYGGPRIRQFFHDRSYTIRDIRDRAEKAYQEAQELANRAAQQLRQLEADQRNLMSELDEETNYQIGQMNDAAREAANRIRRDMELTRVALHDGAQRRLRETMAGAAGRIARELVSRHIQASDQARLLQGFLDCMDEQARR